MRKIDYFGNLINEKINPFTIGEFESRAIAQKKWRVANYGLYIIDDRYAVARLKGGKITRFTIVGEIENYRTLYTNSRDSDSVCRQALYHGACILTKRGGKTIGLGYDIL